MLGAFMYMIIILNHPLSFCRRATTDSNGFISTIQQSTVSSVATWTTSVKYSSIYGIQSVQKIDTGKDANPGCCILD